MASASAALLSEFVMNIYNFCNQGIRQYDKPVHSILMLPDVLFGHLIVLNECRLLGDWKDSKSIVCHHSFDITPSYYPYTE
jgi:hypothetical protein